MNFRLWFNLSWNELRMRYDSDEHNGEDSCKATFLAREQLCTCATLDCRCFRNKFSNTARRFIGSMLRTAQTSKKQTRSSLTLCGLKFFSFMHFNNAQLHKLRSFVISNLAARLCIHNSINWSVWRDLVCRCAVNFSISLLKVATVRTDFSATSLTNCDSRKVINVIFSRRDITQSFTKYETSFKAPSHVELKAMLTMRTNDIPKTAASWKLQRNFKREFFLFSSPSQTQWAWIGVNDEKPCARRL